MSEAQEIGGVSAWKPLPYHEGIREYLKAEEPEVWNWFTSNRVRDDQADSIRFDLLKATYRVDRESQPRVYEVAEDVKTKLMLDVPLTIYQAQNPSGLNASIASLPNEAHLVLHGPIVSRLTDSELRALVAHELSHLLLWRDWDGEYLIVDQVLAAMTHDQHAEMPHFSSARLFGLYTEIFCDRGSLFVAGDPLVVVSQLVKILTELEEVSAESYIRQADEIFTKETARADQLTHPEAFIRARAVKLWADREADADAKISAMIEGPDRIEELDLLGQKRVAAVTRRIVDRLLAPAWLQTELVMGHARLFFDDYVVSQTADADASLVEAVTQSDKSMQDYYCYVLLDFVTIDRDLEELPLAAALVLCEELGLSSRFAEIARRELRLRKRQFEKINEQKRSLLAKADDATAQR